MTSAALTKQHNSPHKEVVLAKALLNAAEQLGLKQQQLANVLGVHRTAISRLRSKLALDPASKQGEIALLLIRIARALSALTGGDREWMQHFMHSPNKVTQGVPAEQITTIQGLVRVMTFVDGIRGKL
jgi:transcriptional regulator with XRE-family HTH domain